MKRVCAWCPKPHGYGEAEPLEDKRVTHGMCPKAAAIENAKLDVMLEKAVAPAAPLFFTPHIVETRRFNDGDTTPNLGGLNP